MDVEASSGAGVPVPFTNMAVSLSGGGYRATGFHLGTLSYLDYRQHNGQSLLQSVSILSTISGGTLTGAMYALKLAQGGAFQDCFEKLYRLLSENRLVDMALKKLNKPRRWRNNHKTRDLINAFAEVYDEHFFDGATFETLRGIEHSHLQDAIFGSSEFTTGIQFRWQETDDGGVFGNYYLSLPEQAAQQVRLADAAAASSCFPGGFEPMIMPTDFATGPGSAVEEAWLKNAEGELRYPITAIMDGGIVDNQGIAGVRLAEDRHSDHPQPYIGTFIISDVSSAELEPYQVPSFKGGAIKNLVTLRRLNVLTLLISAGVIALLTFGNTSLWTVVTGTIWLTLATMWFASNVIVSRLIEGQVSSVFGNLRAPEIISHLKVLLTRAPLYIVIYLVKFRVTSVMKMVSDIFLRQIRRLELNGLYDSSEWNYRIRSNFIYSLQKECEKLPPAMQEVVQQANTMPTTLWFSERDVAENMLDKLIACGQLTTCYNLIQYINELRDGGLTNTVWEKLGDEERWRLIELHEALCADWLVFEANPYWLLERCNRVAKE